MDVREDLENLKNEIEYITRIDYVEPIVRNEVKQLLIDVYQGTTRELEHIDNYLQALEIIVKRYVDIEALTRCDDADDYNSR